MGKADRPVHALSRGTVRNPPYRHKIFQAIYGRASEGRVVPEEAGGSPPPVAVPRGGPLIPRWTLRATEVHRAVKPGLSFVEGGRS